MCTIELRFGLKLFHEKLNDEKYLGKKLGKYYPFKLISIDRYSVEQLWTHNHQQIKQKKKFILTTVVVYIRGYFLSTYFKMTTICGEESQTRHSFFTNSPRSLYIVTCKKKRIQLGRNDTLWWKHYIFFFVYHKWNEELVIYVYKFLIWLSHFNFNRKKKHANFFSF